MRISEIIQQEFRTGEAASKKNKKLVGKIGTHYRYGPARLALALSLADKRPVKFKEAEVKGEAIRGRALFGEESDMVAWIALITQHAGRELDKHAFVNAVAAHWERGINILSKMWEDADGNFDRFIVALAEKSGLSTKEPVEVSPVPIAGATNISSPSANGSVDLHIGEFVGGDKEGEPADWSVNSPGHPPHIAVMGASGGGKTHLALQFVEDIYAQSGCTTFIFDIKGDIAEKEDLRRKINAEVIKYPGTPVPLDILHIGDHADNTVIQNTAARFCDSLACVAGGRGLVQTDRLRQTVARIIAKESKVSVSRLRTELLKQYQEENIKTDTVITALNTICDYNLFVPEFAPGDFFNRNWIFSVNAATEGVQKFSTLMILDALNRYFSGLPEAPVDAEDNRRIRILLAVDEAHRILGYRHEALVDIVRLSRSKGGVVVLISQSPTDYKQEKTNFLEHIGLTISYRTDAEKAAVKKVFSESVPVSRLERGTCFAKLSGQEQSVRKIKVWE